VKILYFIFKVYFIGRIIEIMNMLAKYSIAFGTCLILVFSTTGCGQKGKADTKTVPVLVSPVTEKLKTDVVKKGTIERTGYKAGNVVPVNKVDMCFKFKGGYLAALNVKAGDMVKKGQVLAELDTTDKKNAIKEEEIRLKQAQLAYDNAVQNGASEIQKQILQLNIDAENLKMQQLKEDLKNAVLTADISGKVINVADIKISQFISGYQPLLTIADTTSIQVQCDGNLPDFAIGSKAVIKNGNKTYKGEIVTNTYQPNVNSQNARVVVKLLEDTKDFSIGDGVTVVCTFEKKENALIVPYKAVKAGDDGHSYVRIYDKEDIIERYVEKGIQEGDHIELTSGVSEGEMIILN
jgi:RND family efflux transporter MFP subunit